jgi:hypothetical protein
MDFICLEVDLTAHRRARLQEADDLEMEDNKLTDAFAERMQRQGTLPPCLLDWLVGCSLV